MTNPGDNPAPPLEALSIETPIHGRYLVRVPASPPAGWVVGFHGYKENAEVQMHRLSAIPVSDWLLVSIQGLSRFYRGRSTEVIASWMTRQDRELAIADNRDYVSRVIDTLRRRFPMDGPCVFAGFSQGVAMAYRAAVALSQSSPSVSVGVVAVGGDLPPELEPSGLSRLAAVLVIRGERDDWYTTAKCQSDAARLAAAGVPAQVAVIDAEHAWNDECGQRAGELMRRLLK